ncbi:hypothetical protein D9619_005650 [Psilocybe cf. subviscida]|uniref:Zinc finger PHD-type domain-containing protein n=1 Tax=Psilocybe cf. subviscida TaxID=2480587 RepID=A0A8H5FBI0_9AGAR|nr:hypothetical protein D9619_005650 [Psilocybe cf. subviscida]
MSFETETQHPPRKPPASLFSPLLHQLQTSNPIEFSLPEDIRNFFKDVVAGPKGNYVDSSGVKPPRLNRHGQLEDRDPHRLRDRNGGPVLCFQCGLSALPDNLTANAPAAKRTRRSTSNATTPEAWKGIVSCDYCNLHWHMDCVDPPLLTMPPLTKKWMCPNHAERVMPHKRRIPKQSAPAIEITKPGQFNNGNIDVILPEFSTTIPNRHMPADEVLINGRRYRVPERVIVLDFWNKLNKYDEHVNREPEIASGVSSPLTSLSSLEDEDRIYPSSGPSNGVDELVAAQLLCNLSVARRAEPSRGSPAYLSERATQTDQAAPPHPPKNKVGRPRKYPLVPKPAPHVSERRIIASRSSESANTSSSITISTIRRRRPSQQVAAEPSTRELRSRSRNTHAEVQLTATSSRDTLKQSEDPNARTRLVNVKTEEVEAPSLSNPSPAANLAATAGPTVKPAKIVRTPRQSKLKESDNPVKEMKEKRGRKRKVRDDEVPANSVGENGAVNPSLLDAQKSGKDAQTNDVTRTPIRQGQLQSSNQETPPTSSAGPMNSPSNLATPSLKIRLPRLSNLTGKKTLSSTHIDTPTSLS